MVDFICLHRPPVARQTIVADIGQKMLRFSEVSNQHSPALQKPDLILNGCCWFSISHGQKKYPIEAMYAPMGYHEFFRKAIKKQDSPWDADLTGSVASTVGAKVTYLFISVKYLLDFVH